MPGSSSPNAGGGGGGPGDPYNAHLHYPGAQKQSLTYRIRHKLPFPTHIPLYATLTYLGAICLFSISFLVFLNSSLSFVVTDLLGIHKGIGNIVGTLGFVDELVAVVSVIAWGTLSDKIGTRLVAVIGYVLVGLSLFLVVQVKNVYPQLLLARMLFSLGASATATMVSAVLPELSTLPPPAPQPVTSESTDSIDFIPDRPPLGPPPGSSSTSTRSNRSTITSSRSSSVSYRRHRPRRSRQISTGTAPRSITGQLSGLVGFTAGIGALLALAVFLPLPTHYAEREGVTKEQAVKYSFYTVGTISFIISIVCFVGLRGGIGGSTSKLWVWHVLFGSNSKGKQIDSENGEQSTLLPRTEEADESVSEVEVTPYGAVNGHVNKVISPDKRNKNRETWKSVMNSYFSGLYLAFKAGHEDWRLGLAYLGGFVARASSVGISLFIPLYVNQYMLSRGICSPSTPDDPRLKESCRAAYILAAELTGTSQLMALLSAPLIGYLSDRYHPEIPLLTSGVLGVCSFAGFAGLPSLSPGADRSWAFVLVAGMGIAQIGAIVSSLALVSKAVAGHPAAPSLNQIHGGGRGSHLIVSEALSVNPMTMQPDEYKSKDRMALKGSIAGVYSLFGAIGILILTKLGGWGADVWGRGVPFVLLSLFFVVEVTVGCWLVVKRSPMAL